MTNYPNQFDDSNSLPTVTVATQPGPPGPTGPTGATGQTGPTGSPGATGATGAGVGAVLSWGNASISSTSDTKNLDPWWVRAVPQAAGLTLLYPVPVSGTIKNMYILCATNAGDNIYVFTLMKNGIATALTATIGGGSTTANNVTNTVNVVAGDTLAMRVVTTIGTNTTSPTNVFVTVVIK